MPLATKVTEMKAPPATRRTSSKRAFASKRRRGLDLSLRVFERAVAADNYEIVLATLGIGVLELSHRTRPAEVQGPMVDYETQTIEDMLGAAYVACQGQINAVVRAALKIPGQTLGETELRALGPRFNPEYSKNEVLWALANYFKHRDEWSKDTWDKPPKRSKQTVDIIKSVGLAWGSSENLRAGAAALGNKQYCEMTVFNRIVQRWSAHVREHVSKLGEGQLVTRGRG